MNGPPVAVHTVLVNYGISHGGHTLYYSCWYTILGKGKKLRKTKCVVEVFFFDNMAEIMCFCPSISHYTDTLFRKKMIFFHEYIRVKIIFAINPQLFLFLFCYTNEKLFFSLLLFLPPSYCRPTATSCSTSSSYLVSC